MATGVTIVNETVKILPPERMATDMTHRHIEAIDLSADDTDAEPPPLRLTEEDEHAALAAHLQEGGEIEVDDDALQSSPLPATMAPASPAATARRRSSSQRGARA